MDPQSSSDMSRLAVGPHSVHQAACILLHTEIARAAEFLQAPRVLMIWEELEEPWVHLALWSHDGFDLRQEPPGTLDWQVAVPLIGRSFLCLDVGAQVPTVLYTSPAGLQQWFGQPLHPQLRAQFAIATLLSSVIRGTAFAGRLFFLDRLDLTGDHLARADRIAHQLAQTVDQFCLKQQWQRAAVVEERRRLARNLHDGVLQSLTIITLQLHEVQRALGGNPHSASEQLQKIQRLVADEQRDLRFLVEGLTARAQGTSDTDLCLVDRLETLSRELERLWGLRVECHLKLPESRLSTGLLYEIYYVIREALLNAARHARASAVHVELAIQKDHVQITVADNGQGFPFQGHYTLTALIELQRGPVMLKERIASLGGSLTLDSSAAGARLDIGLPLLPPGYQRGDPARARR
jgi:signal transduction histidine kinase